MQFDPALPWSYGDGGTITLNEEVTQEQLLLGRVHLVVDYDDTVVDATFALSGSQLVAKAEDTTVYNVSLDETGHVLTLTAVVNNVMPISAEIVLAPVAGSLKAHKVEGLLDDYCLTCLMTDGTQRALTQGGELILGYQYALDTALAEFSFEPTPLVETSETKPSPVPFHFIDLYAIVPPSLELDTIEVSYDYAHYQYDAEAENASFEVQLLADSVQVDTVNTIVSNDTSPIRIAIDNPLPDLTFSPSLPWAVGTGGTVTLNNLNSVTEAELIAGKLKFTATYNGTAVETHVAKDASDNLHLYNGDDIQMYAIQIDQTGTAVTLTPESSGSVITAVRLGTLRHAVEVFADSQCTQKPVIGVVYSYLIVRINKDYGFNEQVTYGNDNNSVTVNTPTEEYPDDKYDINLYIDWTSNSYESPFTEGQIVECHAQNIDFVSGLSTEFGPEVYV